MLEQGEFYTRHGGGRGGMINSLLLSKLYKQLEKGLLQNMKLECLRDELHLDGGRRRDLKRNK